MTDTRKQVEREIAEWLRAFAKDDYGTNAEEHLSWWIADRIERGEYRKDEA